MITELEQIIQTEEAKPEAERDENLIDDCIHEIAELKGVKAEYSDEEVKEITDELIKKTDREKRKKRLIRYIAGIAAVFVLVGGVTACTFNPALINWIRKIAQMPFGSSVEQESLSYYFQGSSIEYRSVEELLSKTDLDVYYPTVLPNQTKLKAIEILEENSLVTIVFKFSPSTFHYIIQLQYVDPKVGKEATTEIETHDFLFTVYSENDSYFAFAEDGGNTYSVQSDNMDDIILFVGGLRKE